MDLMHSPHFAVEKASLVPRYTSDNEIDKFNLLMLALNIGLFE
jgi:hypothetical protein